LLFQGAVTRGGAKQKHPEWMNNKGASFMNIKCMVGALFALTFTTGVFANEFEANMEYQNCKFEQTNSDDGLTKVIKLRVGFNSTTNEISVDGKSIYGREDSIKFNLGESINQGMESGDYKAFIVEAKKIVDRMSPNRADLSYDYYLKHPEIISLRRIEIHVCALGTSVLLPVGKCDQYIGF
jgi:hypothetical protein